MGLLTLLINGPRGSSLAMLDDQGVEVRDLSLDLTNTETHSISVAVSEHPLETGEAVTDHIRRLPDVVSIEGLFSNTAISLFDKGLRAQEGEAHTVRALGFFEELANQKRLVNFSNRFKAYRNMVCTGITFTRNQNQGDAVKFSVTFRQVLFAESRVVVDTASLRGPNSSTRNQGKLAPSTPTPEVQGKVGSVASRITGLGG